VVVTDSTIMARLEPAQMAKMRMWIDAGDEGNSCNIFDFTLNRGCDRPMGLLKGYREVLLADGLGGYNGVVAGYEISRAACWARACRKLVGARKAAPEIAWEAMALVGALYEVERASTG
jgi:hypothetical protein